jgi:hypothetical protein
MGSGIGTLVPYLRAHTTEQAILGQGPQDPCVRVDCARLPKARRDAIDQEAEIFGYLRQSRISEQNLARLRTLAATATPNVVELARIAVAVAEITPTKRGRLRLLAHERRDLLAALERTNLIAAHHG